MIFNQLIMIQANDVRLGNWVINPNNGEYSQITAMDISDIQSNIKIRDGVKLTEEVLLCINGMQNLWDGAFCLPITDKLNWVLNQREDYFYFIDVNLKYLHELQNLVYSHHKKELEVEL